MGWKGSSDEHVMDVVWIYPLRFFIGRVQCEDVDNLALDIVMVEALYVSTFVIPNQLIFGYDALLQLLRFEPQK